MPMNARHGVATYTDSATPPLAFGKRVRGLNDSADFAALGGVTTRMCGAGITKMRSARSPRARAAGTPASSQPPCAVSRATSAPTACFMRASLVL